MDKNIKITRSSRRSIAIMIGTNGMVVVKAPKYIPEFVIKTFIKSKEDWIKKRQEHVLKSRSTPKKIANGETFSLLGRDYEINIGNFTSIEIKNGKLQFPLGMVKNGIVMLEKWYIKQAKLIIKNLVDEYSVKMEAPYNGISFSDTNSKWGSCTHDNRLQFNWRLVMTPILVVRYVVIHELVHTFEKNHSSFFWSKVRKFNPSYKQQVKWLKVNGEKLQNFLQ